MNLLLATIRIEQTATKTFVFVLVEQFIVKLHDSETNLDVTLVVLDYYELSYSHFLFFYVMQIYG